MKRVKDILKVKLKLIYMKHCSTNTQFYSTTCAPVTKKCPSDSLLHPVEQVQIVLVVGLHGTSSWHFDLCDMLCTLSLSVRHFLKSHYDLSESF